MAKALAPTRQLASTSAARTARRSESIVGVCQLSSNASKCPKARRRGVKRCGLKIDIGVLDICVTWMRRTYGKDLNFEGCNAELWRS